MDFAADLKRASVLRRVPRTVGDRYLPMPGLEGHICAFELAREGSPIVIEDVSGRSTIVAPGDIFLGTPGHRESTRWVVGGIPDGGLVPRSNYWVLAESGVVGELVGNSPLEKSHLGQVKYLGVACDEGGQIRNIRQFAESAPADSTDREAMIYLVVGTSAEVGKTTAGIAVLRALRQKRYATVIVLKATGTSSLGELTTYQDFGAAQTFDCVDFGLPTTYPSGRDGMGRVFESALDTCLTIPADAVVVECGGDMLGANVPIFLDRLKRRRSEVKVILAAADAFGALGGKQIMQNMKLVPELITGPCTDTPTLQKRTETLCGIPAINMARGGNEEALFQLASATAPAKQKRVRAQKAR